MESAVITPSFDASVLPPSVPKFGGTEWCHQSGAQPSTTTLVVFVIMYFLVNPGSLGLIYSVACVLLPEGFYQNI
jgi:hypothetical protein